MQQFFRTQFILQGGKGMKGKYFLILCLLLFLCGGTVSASSGGGTDSLRITDENRFDPEFYRQPEARYASQGGEGRSARAGLDFETYIIEQLQQFATTIDVSGYGISNGKAGSAYFQILNSHPELFYVEGSVNWRYNSSGMVTQYYNIKYRDAQANIQRQQKELEAAANEALTWVDDSMSDMEKALVIHDYLVLNCEYDQERLQNGTVPAYSHSAYGALVSRLAVCDGYSHAYSYILEKLGIPCELVTSDSMNHAWNMVSIGGDWYHVDVTWDDPIWDSIGRVLHSYFLLSDQVISDSGHKHANWSAGHTAVSDTYKQAFWTGIQSAFCYWRGNWYYARYNGTSRTGDVLKKQELLGSGEETVCSESNLWGSYGGNYMYLDFDAGRNAIYFNSGTSIFRLEDEKWAEMVYEPELSANQYIFGFTIKEDQLCYWLSNSPNVSRKQSLRTHPVPEQALSQITGISAENLTAVYDGKWKLIQVKGTKNGDYVTYAGENGVFGAEQPEMKDAGVYQVSYKVERSGCQPFQGQAQIVIEKAEPIYAVPEGLQIVKGQELGEVKLPERFFWETDTAKKWQTEGEVICYVLYSPEDSRNYKTVSHIPVKVTVVKEEGPDTPSEGDKEEEPDIPPEGERPGEEKPKEPDDPSGGEGTPGQPDHSPEEENPDTPPEEDQPSIPSEVNPEDTEKEVPSFIPPKGLSGHSGKMLSSVKLPAGFVWQTSESTRLWREGSYTYYVKYVPGDTKKYVSVSNIPVKVQVICPEHRYISEVTRAATRTRKGQETFSCEICGNAYTREISLELPKKPEPVSGLKVTKVSANSLQFSWKKTEGVKYRAVLYQKNAVVATGYTDKNVYAFSKLQSAADYQMKVTAYREIDGGKYYADQEASVKASTALGKVKLVSVKGQGTGKVKITWKKVSGAGGYEIFMKTGTGSYKKIKSIAKGKTVAFTKSGLKKGKNYSFRIRAYKKSGGKKAYGAYSNVKTWKRK